jgi:PhzF family phenazine biosynthesis protein
MNITACVVSAFTCNGSGGNKAGVVLSAGQLSRQHMQDAAKQLGYSETAFVSPGTLATYRVRFFTPTEEVDLCGHATIATWSLLFQRGFVRSGANSQETLAGKLGIIVGSDGSVFMQQTKPRLFSNVDKAEVARVLGVRAGSLHNDLMPQIVSTGLQDLLVPMRTKTALMGIVPALANITTLSEKYDITGLHVFALSENGGQTIASARNFAPRVGINEESATGTSNGALLCYLQKYGKLENTGVYRIEQGESMGQLSCILGRFTKGRVWIGGQASILEERSLDV